MVSHGEQLSIVLLSMNLTWELNGLHILILSEETIRNGHVGIIGLFHIASVSLASRNKPVNDRRMRMIEVLGREIFCR